MNVEYTGRQFEITPITRKQVEGGLEKLKKILGNFDTHVILSTEKRRQIAEITVSVRNHAPIVGLSEAAEMSVAIGGALDKIERQAVKYNTRWKSKKRQARKKLAQNGNAQEEVNLAIAVGGDLTTAVPVKVHSFPSVVKVTEAHIVKSSDSVSYKPLTLEEAVKEAEFRDREVFVFRDPEGRVKVLHRKKDGRMELIEAP
ncbi:MAG TPA: ribosome-associated translation inhibitor RaiA [Candidatus Angelobacter sp.]|nr:ribosome-associated translation inhibitor RaiA [Candidatus Angelobacter sp.]